LAGSSRAWVQHAARNLTLEELPLPDVLAPGDALAKVEASGICGSDYEQYVGHFDKTGHFSYPLVIGHEPVVRIEAIGAEAAERWGVRVGDRVAVEPHVGCGVCAYCMSGRQVLCPRKLQYGYMPLGLRTGLWGSLADYMVLSGNTVLHKLPESISTEDALMFNPLAAGFEWAVLKGRVGIGDDVLILGAGQRGLACVIACALAGANRIVITGLEPDRDKLQIAKRLGATDIVVTDPANPDSLTEQLGTSFADVVVDVVPAATQPVLDAIKAVRTGGRIVLGGIKGMREVAGFVSDDLIFKSISLLGALGVSSKGYQQAVSAVISERFDFSDWHTHTVPLAEAEEAIKILGGEGDSTITPIHVSVVAS
jgi:threonine dehydrogenase-like Zn-dependent dehydrogenase